MGKTKPFDLFYMLTLQLVLQPTSHPVNESIFLVILDRRVGHVYTLWFCLTVFSYIVDI